jgi:hypothetical protein
MEQVVPFGGVDFQAGTAGVYCAPVIPMSGEPKDCSPILAAIQTPGQAVIPSGSEESRFEARFLAAARNDKSLAGDSRSAAETELLPANVPNLRAR